jgi:hypothetical protein
VRGNSTETLKGVGGSNADPVQESKQNGSQMRQPSIVREGEGAYIGGVSTDGTSFQYIHSHYSRNNGPEQKISQLLQQSTRHSHLRRKNEFTYCTSREAFVVPLY